jgi:hypothetical protein
MSLAWYQKNGGDDAFNEPSHGKAKLVLAEHTKRVTGDITVDACRKAVEEIIAR